MSSRDPNLFARIGPQLLRDVIVDFYDRVFADVMIGFLFAGKDKQRLVNKEWELTARFLGADIAYTGRPMRMAHAASPIFGGHFERRLQILRETMAAHAVDPEVVRVWIEHQQALRSQITADRGSECKDSGVAAELGERASLVGEGPAVVPARASGGTAVVVSAETAPGVDALEPLALKPSVEATLVRLGRKPS